MEIDINWYIDTQIAVGIAWDRLPKQNMRLTFYILFLVVAVDIWDGKDQERLPSITDQPCQCLRCGWSGTVWDCEGDVDGDGSLGCPECLAIIEVFA